MIVVVTGGREFKNDEFIFETLDKLHRESPINILVEGGARGADRGARLWAKQNNVLSKTYYPDWMRYGNAAGAIRNRAMLIGESPDLVIAFPGDKGTKNMIMQARRAKVKVRKFDPRFGEVY